MTSKQIRFEIERFENRLLKGRMPTAMECISFSIVVKNLWADYLSAIAVCEELKYQLQAKETTLGCRHCHK